MRQAVLTAPERIEFREVPDLTAAQLGEDEILIRIKKIGICGSEIHSYHGEHPATFYPVVQGHEYSGIVTAVGSKVTRCKPGDKVTARPQLTCGQCAPCRRGQYNVCENLRVQAFQADGAAQDYFIVPEERLVKLPETFSLEYGAMIEPAAVGDGMCGERRHDRRRGGFRQRSGPQHVLPRGTRTHPRGNHDVPP